ncbi:MAG TPA: tetratricopeptide repeat protein [Casimicrobiaceae bacterium]|nr:tetratricopeptide repeat protein [Casimicrobiaceae bacterium]
MKNDLRGIPVTGADSVAILRYETALKQFQSYVGDPIATIDEAIAQAPGFIAAHLFKAFVLYTLAERQFVPMAAESLDAAQVHARFANSRELTLLAAGDKLVGGDWQGASRLLDRVLIDYPRDAFTVQVAHLLDFFRGDALNLRNRISRVLPSWDETVPGFSYVLGMHAFGLEEMNQYADAEATAMRALSIEPRDGWAVHAVVHVMEMQGRVDEGIAFLASREGDWAPDNAFAFHNYWHLGLFHMDAGRHDRALALWDTSIHPGPAPYLLSLIDATAMLWRMHLEGVDIGNRFAQVADEWQARIESEPGFYAFNDAHAAMAFVATGRERELDKLVVGMAHGAGAQTLNASMTRDVGLPLVEGLRAFGQRRYADAIAAIEPVRDIANRFGGSHAQRDVITLTMIEAAIRSGDGRRARHYLAERLVHKPDSAWAGRLMRRTARQAMAKAA